MVYISHFNKKYVIVFKFSNSDKIIYTLRKYFAFSLKFVLYFTY